jgi:hypothetical protein
MISALYETNMLSCILYSASSLGKTVCEEIYRSTCGHIILIPSHPVFYYESVKWIVFADVIEMSEDQVEYLKNGWHC